MPAEIMNKTSHPHCVSNNATLRNKNALHVLSHQICKYSCAEEKNTYTFTYLGSLVTLYTFDKNKSKFDIIVGNYRRGVLRAKE